MVDDHTSWMNRMFAHWGRYTPPEDLMAIFTDSLLDANQTVHNSAGLIVRHLTIHLEIAGERQGIREALASILESTECIFAMGRVQNIILQQGTQATILARLVSAPDYVKLFPEMEGWAGMSPESVLKGSLPEFQREAEAMRESIYMFEEQVNRSLELPSDVQAELEELARDIVRCAGKIIDILSIVPQYLEFRKRPGSETREA